MIAGIISGVNTLLSRLTSSRAGYIDKLNVSGNLTTDTNWTSTRAAYLDKLNISGNVASATDALSNATWTSAHASKLAALRPIPQIKVQATGITTSATNALLTTATRYFCYCDVLNSYVTTVAVNADKKFGFRWAESNAVSLTDVVNLSGQGWVLGVGLVNGSGSTYNGQTILTVDGTTVIDTTYASLLTGEGKMLIGRWYYTGASPSHIMILAVYPMRFDTSLRVQHYGGNSGVYTQVVYLLD